MQIDKKRWLILVASCLINLCIGSLYAWSVFSSPMAETINAMYGLNGTAALTASNLAIVFTVANAVGPITMISGGTINDKLGPKWVIFVGGLLFGLGMLACGFATGTGFLIVSYGLGCGLGMGMVYGCTISNSVKFFPDKRGLIGGIATASYGLSSVLISPIANALIAGKGVMSTFRILGIVILIVICGCAFFVERCPEGYQPAGWEPKVNIQAQMVSNDKNWKQMLADSMFYLMILMLMCGAFCGLMIISQASPMAQKIVGMSSAMAATCVSVLALFNAAGRIVAGFLSDKFGGSNTLSCVFVLSILGLGLLMISGEGTRVVFIAGLAIVGFCFGSFMGVFPGFTAAQFGTKNNSMNYGFMFIGFALAGIFGPMLAGKILAATNSYQYAFVAAGALSVIGLVLSFVYRKLKR